MKRFWASWYSGNYADEGCTAPPFKFWISGQCDRPNYGMIEEKYQEYLKIEAEEKAEDFSAKIIATIALCVQ